LLIATRSRGGRSGFIVTTLSEKVLNRLALFQQSDALPILELSKLRPLVRRQDFVDIILHAIDGKVRLSPQNVQSVGVLKENFVGCFALVAVKIKLVEHLPHNPGTQRHDDGLLLLVRSLPPPLIVSGPARHEDPAGNDPGDKDGEKNQTDH
jgi:hypothetical protein